MAKTVGSKNVPKKDGKEVKTTSNNAGEKKK